MTARLREPSAAVRSAHAPHEAALIVRWLRSARVTVLLGPAGSGKTAWLREQVLPMLARRAPDIPVERRDPSRVVVPMFERRSAGIVAASVRSIEVPIYFTGWGELPLQALRCQIEASTAWIAPRAMTSAGSLAASLADFCRGRCARVLLLLDGFDRHLAQPAERADIVEFDRALIDVMNRPALPVQVLLVLRPEAAPGLERYRREVDGFDEHLLHFGAGEPRAASGFPLLWQGDGPPPLTAEGNEPAPGGSQAGHEPATAPDAVVAPGEGTDAAWMASLASALAKVAAVGREGKAHADPQPRAEVSVPAPAPVEVAVPGPAPAVPARVLPTLTDELPTLGTEPEAGVAPATAATAATAPTAATATTAEASAPAATTRPPAAFAARDRARRPRRFIALGAAAAACGILLALVWRSPEGDASRPSARANEPPTAPVAAATPPPAAATPPQIAATPPQIAATAVAAPLVVDTPRLALRIDPSSGDLRLAADLARFVAPVAGISLQPVDGSEAATGRAGAPERAGLEVMRYDALQAARRGPDRPPLRVVLPLGVEPIAFAVRDDSPLRYVHELRGKRIDLGATDSARAVSGQAAYRSLFGAAAAPRTGASLSQEAAIDALRHGDGALDAVALLGTSPPAGLRVLAWDPALEPGRRALRDYLPARLDGTPTLGVMSFLVARGELRDATERAAVVELAHGLCAALLALRQQGDPRWRLLNPGVEFDTGWPVLEEAAAAWRACAPSPAVARSAR